MAIDDIALTLVPGLGVKGVVHLLEVFGTAQAIFAASADELAGRAELRPDVARSIAARKSHPEAERELRHCRRHGITPLASTDDAYPALLRENIRRGRMYPPPNRTPDHPYPHKF